MLPRIHRLPARERLANPRIFHSSFYTLRAAPSPTDVSRASLVISKKVDKRAVKRNALRRIVNSVLEEQLPKQKPPLDLIIILKPRVAQLEPKTLREEVQIALAKATTL